MLLVGRGKEGNQVQRECRVSVDSVDNRVRWVRRATLVLLERWVLRGASDQKEKLALLVRLAQGGVQE